MWIGWLSVLALLQISALGPAGGRGMRQAEAGAAAEPQGWGSRSSSGPGPSPEPVPSWLIGPLSHLHIFSPF